MSAGLQPASSSMSITLRRPRWFPQFCCQQSLDRVAGRKDSPIFPAAATPQPRVLTRPEAWRLTDRSDSSRARFGFHCKNNSDWEVCTVFKLLVRVLFAIEGLLLLGSLGHGAVVPSGSAAAQPACRGDAAHWNHRCHHQLSPSGGQQAQSLGRPRALRPGVACRSQRKYDHQVHRSGDHRGQAAAQGNLRPAHDSRRKRVDRHLLQKFNFLGQLHLRPGRRRAAGHGEAAGHRVSRSARPTTSTM